MGPPCPPEQIPTNLDCQVTQMMANVLAAFSAGPGGTAHPSHNNLADYGIAPGYVHPVPK
jgi:hypothetical protein